jgi:hypothetical protein
MGGGLGCWYMLAFIGLIEVGLDIIIHGPQGPKGLLAFHMGFYVVWLFLDWLFARKVELIFWALAMLPIPSLLLAGWLLTAS